MKVNNHKDSVELSNVARSKRGDRANAAKNKENAEAAPAQGAGSTANVEISSEAKAMNSAKQIAGADTTDQAKIDKIKAAIQAGTYKPDFGKVADKMVTETLLQEIS